MFLLGNVGEGIFFALISTLSALFLKAGLLTTPVVVLILVASALASMHCGNALRALMISTSDCLTPRAAVSIQHVH